MNTITQNDVESFEAIKNVFMNKINSMSREEAIKYVDGLLIDAGILDGNGNEKDQIVTGDFFGW